MVGGKYENGLKESNARISNVENRDSNKNMDNSHVDNDNIFPFSEQVCISTLMDDNVVEVTDTLDDTLANATTDYEYSEPDSQLNFSFISDNLNPDDAIIIEDDAPDSIMQFTQMTLKQENEDCNEQNWRTPVRTFESPSIIDAIGNEVSFIDNNLNDGENNANDSNNYIPNNSKQLTNIEVDQNWGHEISSDPHIGNDFMLEGPMPCDPPSFPLTNFGLTDIENLNFSSENNISFHSTDEVVVATPTTLTKLGGNFMNDFSKKNYTVGELWPNMPNKMDLISRTGNKNHQTANTVNDNSNKQMDNLISNSLKKTVKNSTKIESKPKRFNDLIQKYKMKHVESINVKKMKNNIANKIDKNFCAVRMNSRTPVVSSTKKTKLQTKHVEVKSTPDKGPIILNCAINLPTFVSNEELNNQTVSDCETQTNLIESVETKAANLEANSVKTILTDCKEKQIQDQTPIVLNSLCNLPSLSSEKLHSIVAHPDNKVETVVVSEEKKTKTVSKTQASGDVSSNNENVSGDTTTKTKVATPIIEVYESSYDLIKRRKRPTTNYCIEKILFDDSVNSKRSKSKPKDQKQSTSSKPSPVNEMKLKEKGVTETRVNASKKRKESTSKKRKLDEDDVKSVHETAEVLFDRLVENEKHKAKQENADKINKDDKSKTKANDKKRKADEVNEETISKKRKEAHRTPSPPNKNNPTNKCKPESDSYSKKYKEIDTQKRDSYSRKDSLPLRKDYPQKDYPVKENGGTRRRESTSTRRDVASNNFSQDRNQYYNSFKNPRRYSYDNGSTGSGGSSYASSDPERRYHHDTGSSSAHSSDQQRYNVKASSSREYHSRHHNMGNRDYFERR